MKHFQYQILRYRPDQVGGEFVNVGLVVFSQETNFLMVRSAPSTARAKAIFPNLKGTALQTRLKHFADHLNALHEQRSRELSLNPITDITQITHAALPPDDSAVYWSEVGLGRDLDLSVAFEDLFERFINRHLKTTPVRTSDTAVWRESYKTYFERPDIKRYLTKHTVKTDENNVFEFDHAVKNGVWHFMEPVAFDLKSEDRIKDKVFKWVGKVAELEKSEEEFRLYLLTRLPNEEEVRAFVRNRLEKKLSAGREVEIVVPGEAETLVTNLVKAVEEGRTE